MEDLRVKEAGLGSSTPTSAQGMGRKQRDQCASYLSPEPASILGAMSTNPGEEREAPPVLVRRKSALIHFTRGQTALHRCHPKSTLAVRNSTNMIKIGGEHT